MATFLDLALVEFFEPVVTFILVYAIVYGVLSSIKSKMFGDENSSLNALIALGVSLLFALSPGLRKVLSIALPWYALLFVVLGFMLMFFYFVGVEQDDVKELFSSTKYGFVIFLTIVVFVIIFVSSLMAVYGDDLRNMSDANYTDSRVEEIPDEAYADNVMLTLVHPKVLGTLFLLIFSGAVVFLLSHSEDGM
ncbi:MAG: hypothetical protein ACOCRX_00200 [Candidatus Woesearchaeota archaeon]